MLRKTLSIVGSSSLVAYWLVNRPSAQYKPVSFKQTASHPIPTPHHSRLNLADLVLTADKRSDTFLLELNKQKSSLTEADITSIALAAVTSHQAEAFNLLAAHFPEHVNTTLLKAAQPGPTFVFRMGVIEEEKRLAASLRDFTVIPAENPEHYRHLIANPRGLTLFSRHRYGEFDGECSLEPILPHKDKTTTR